MRLAAQWAGSASLFCSPRINPVAYSPERYADSPGVSRFLPHLLKTVAAV